MFSSARDAHVVAAVAFGVAALAASVLRPRRALLAAALFLGGVAPVIWFGRQAGGTFASRFSYLPGIGIAAFLALGIDALRSVASPTHRQLTRPAAAVVLMYLATYVAGSLAFQASLWQRAWAIARVTLEQAAPVLTRPSPGVHLANLPVLCQEGPVIMKAYAFRMVLGRVSPLRADGVVVSCEADQVRSLGPAEVQGSEYAGPVPGETELVLEFGALAR